MNNIIKEGIYVNLTEHNQLVQDGFQNLIPLIKRTGLTVKQIRKAVGKSNWKTLNSFSYIEVEKFQLFLSCFYRVLRYRCYFNLLFKHRNILNINKSLFNLPPFHIDPLIALLDKIKSINEEDFYKVFILLEKIKEEGLGSYEIRDTISNAIKTEEPFNLNWSAKRLKKEHKRLSRLATIKELDIDLDHEFKHVKKLKNSLAGQFLKNTQFIKDRGLYYIDDLIFCNKYIERNGFSEVAQINIGDTSINLNPEDIDVFFNDRLVFDEADVFKDYAFKIKFLITPEDYLNESSEMSHCISSYLGSVKNGTYLAFRVQMYRVNRDCKGLITFPFGEFVDEATVGVNVKSSVRKKRYEVEQVKSIKNTSPSSHLKSFIRILSTSIFEKMEYNVNRYHIYIDPSPLNYSRQETQAVYSIGSQEMLQRINQINNNRRFDLTHLTNVVTVDLSR